MMVTGDWKNIFLVTSHESPSHNDNGMIKK